MDLSQRQAIRDGMRRFDLLVPVDPHNGSIYGHGYLALLRPLLRRLYVSVPAVIRARLTRLFSA